MTVPVTSEFAKKYLAEKAAGTPDPMKELLAKILGGALSNPTQTPAPPPVQAPQQPSSLTPEQQQFLLEALRPFMPGAR